MTLVRKKKDKRETEEDPVNQSSKNTIDDNGILKEGNNKKDKEFYKNIRDAVQKYKDVPITDLVYENQIDAKVLLTPEPKEDRVLPKNRFLIVGLGNNDDKLKNTRHNIGFKVIDRLAEILDVKLDQDIGHSVHGVCWLRLDEQPDHHKKKALKELRKKMIQEDLNSVENVGGGEENSQSFRQKLKEGLNVPPPPTPEELKRRQKLLETNKTKCEIIIGKPSLYMNMNGRGVRALKQHCKIPTENVLVILDDIYTEFGDFTIRKEGGPADHNGMKDVIKRCESSKIPRIKVGVNGETRGSIPRANYVLQNFTLSEQESLKVLLNC
eukprot:gene9328-11441_t